MKQNGTLFWAWSFLKIPIVSPSLDHKEQNWVRPPIFIAQLRLCPLLDATVSFRPYLNLKFLQNTHKRKLLKKHLMTIFSLETCGIACLANEQSCNILRFVKINQKCFLGSIQYLPAKDANADAVEVINTLF